MRTYTEAEKVAAVRAYVVQGTFDKAEAATGIDRDTIASWKYRTPEWWDHTITTLLAELLAGCSAEDQARALRLRSRLLSLIETKLDLGGDQKLNVKTGELVRVEILAKEAASIYVQLGGSNPVVDDGKDEEAQKAARQARFKQIAADDRKPN